MNRPGLIIIALLCFFSCSKNTQQTDPALIPDVSKPINLNLTIDQKNPGLVIPKTFEGLSYEVEILTQNPDFLNEQNSAVVQLFKNLGPGVLRFGGNTSDRIPWTGNSRTITNGVNSLNTTDIDRVAKFTTATGWPVIFGLNLGANDPKSAAEEAKYIAATLKGNLNALQMGNEPDYYMFDKLRKSNYGYADFIGEWKSYYSAINSVSPRLPFAGPDVGYNTGWIEALANNERGILRLIDQHYYAYSQAVKPNVAYNDILIKDQGLDKYFQVLHDISKRVNLPYRITECNSVSYGGKVGVSDVFASALWGLDFMWQAAQNNCAGVNFHTGIKTDQHYTAITIDNGSLTARPLYYGMLAFRYATNSNASIVPTVIDNNTYNCNAYACVQADGSYAITIINKEVSKNFSVNVQLSKSASTISIARLTAPLVTSATGVRFANSQVNTDGTFKPNITEQFVINKDTFTINIPASSAAVIKVQTASNTSVQ
ncbi:hypothetical protein G7092_13255 [Mucilaginibacter sp. HC2]|uniref:glycosyl hydrolase family 79 C-terminal domain-containing protein n=1 Tax=Mucilaginibacter inviolabilis TaxID=2714892 RepID=UPI00140D4FA2|nr:glycosyl hydrolase family 79 C-terminal domain-containing protein [Mucilaginibacter inviolabilis]NHA04776.1 hypothetical protein [Mucilaginibacter inviolabilis]